MRKLAFGKMDKLALSFLLEKETAGLYFQLSALDFLSFRLLLGQHLASSPSQNGERSLGTVLFYTKKGKKTQNTKKFTVTFLIFTVSHLADSTGYSMNIALASAYRAQST